MRHAEVLLESYNQDALEKGLGVKMHAISHEQLGKLLSHALGYVDYTDPGIANELMKILDEPELNNPFFELYKEGKVNEHYIEHAIEKWHESSSELELHEYLGLTKEQYARYVEEDKLPDIA